MSLPLVSPCCHTPLDIKSLDEVAIVVLGPSFIDEDETTYGWNSRCCQSCLSKEEADAVTEEEIQKERRYVYKASVRYAEKMHEQRVKELERQLAADLGAFADQHDPDLERIYVVANYGSTHVGQVIPNYRTAEFETRDEAVQSMERRANALLAEGYEEIPSDPARASVELQRSFRTPMKTIHVGMWKQCLADLLSGGGPPYDHATATGMYDHY
jgi:hypothetical protein